jgi:adenosylcobinamide-GDP ribazoletransferase
LADGRRHLPGPLRLTAFAVGFLTRLPTPTVEVRDGDLRRASAVFPLVGLLVATVGVAVRGGLEPWLGVTSSTVAAVLAMVAVTGAFHEDGLADATDGLWGGWTPERRIQIMRDSRIGTYGTVAVVGTLLLRTSLLASVDLVTFVRAVAVGHVVGRGGILAMIRLLPAASDQGHGAEVSDPVGPVGLVVAGATVLATTVLALGWIRGLWPLLAGAAVLLALRRLFRRRVGGVTGDLLGATQQVVQIAATATVVALALSGR